MASAAGASTCVLLLAALFMGTAAAAAEHGGKDGCIQRVDEVPLPGSCLCYDKCTGGGGLTNASSQVCFVNCVLGLDCVCPGDGERTTPDLTEGVPSAETALPALLDGTIRVAVTRPRVSRSLDEKLQAKEVLVVEVSFEDDDPPYFSIHVNAPEGGEPEEFGEGKAVGRGLIPMEERSTGKAVLRNRIGEYLEKIGADGDKTIVVSIWPLSLVLCKAHRLTVTSVRVEYEAW